jgi:hypothetical protein
MTGNERRQCNGSNLQGHERALQANEAEGHEEKPEESAGVPEVGAHETFLHESPASSGKHYHGRNLFATGAAAHSICEEAREQNRRQHGQHRSCLLPPEILPSLANPISMTVSPGDQVTVTIFKAASNLWAIAVDHDTTGQLFRTEQTYTGPGSTADFVVEAPEQINPTTGAPTQLPLASFSPATNFTNLQMVGDTTAIAALVLVEAGVQVSTPSLKTPTGFAVGYGSLAPSPPVGK